MAITTLNTQTPNTPEGGNGGTLKTILILATVVGAAYLGYKYWYKPRFVDKAEEGQQQG